MANIYRFRIDGAQASAHGDVYLDTYLEYSDDDGATWATVQDGHRDVVLDDDAILAITEGPGTDAQKRAALLALFESTVRGWGIIESDDAKKQLEALLPAGWPVTVNL